MHNYGFIVGHYKSGSTWLINLLSLHPELRGVSETSVFSYAAKADTLQRAAANLFSISHWSQSGWRSFARHRANEMFRAFQQSKSSGLPVSDRPSVQWDLSRAARRSLRHELPTCESREEFCRVFFDVLRKEHHPASYLIEKNNNISLVPFIRTAFPDAKLMAIHRDGRDVVVSDRFFQQNEKGTASPLERRATAWRDAMEAHLEFTETHSVFSCSYEALSSDGPRVVRELLDFLDVASNEEIVNDMLERSSFRFRSGRKSGESNASSFYRSGRAGDWVNHFTDEDRRVFKSVAGDLLIRLGYERDLDW